MNHSKQNINDGAKDRRAKKNRRAKDRGKRPALVCYDAL